MSRYFFWRVEPVKYASPFGINRIKHSVIQLYDYFSRFNCKSEDMLTHSLPFTPYLETW